MNSAHTNFLEVLNLFRLQNDFLAFPLFPFIPWVIFLSLTYSFRLKNYPVLLLLSCFSLSTASCSASYLFQITGNPQKTLKTPSLELRLELLMEKVDYTLELGEDAQKNISEKKVEKNVKTASFQSGKNYNLMYMHTSSPPGITC